MWFLVHPPSAVIGAILTRGGVILVCLICAVTQDVNSVANITIR